MNCELSEDSCSPFVKGGGAIIKIGVKKDGFLFHACYIWPNNNFYPLGNNDIIFVYFFVAIILWFYRTELINAQLQALFTS